MTMTENATRLDRVAGSQSNWTSDLRVGLRLAFASGRSNRLRLLMSALGVALCVLVLFMVAAISPSMTARSARLDRIMPNQDGGSAAFRAVTIDLVWHGQHIAGIGVAPLVTDAPPPPGVDRFPNTGEVFLSPALAAAVRQDPTGLGALVPGNPGGTIDSTALPNSDDWVYYVGQPAASLSDYDGASSWGEPAGYLRSLFDANPVLMLILIVGSVIVIAPMVLFLMLASRIGGPARDRRSANLRLIGASRRQIRRYAASEALAGGLIGVGAALLAFFGFRQFVPGLLGVSLTSADIRISVVNVVIIVVAVPIILLGIALFGNRHVVIEPLSVTRRASQRPRLWWRMAYCAAAVGIALLVGSPSHSNSLALASTVALLLLAVPVLLPLLVDRPARWVRSGKVTSRLTLGRLRQDSLTTARTASGISMVLAGAIAMVTLLSGSIGGSSTEAGDNIQAGSVLVATPAEISALPATLRNIPGVNSVTAFEQFDLSDPAHPDAALVVRVADCATIRLWAAVTDCREGDAFAVDSPGAAPTGGFMLTGNNGAQQSWTPPPSSPVAALPDASHQQDAMPSGYLLTVGAADGLPITGSLMIMRATVPAGSLEPAEQALGQEFGFRGLTAMGLSSSSSLISADDQLRILRFGLIIASLLTLLVCALGQLVVGAEQLADRRRALALARAQGVPLRVIATSMVQVAVIPAVLGAVIAAAVGLWISHLVVAASFSTLVGTTGWSIPAMAVGAVVFVLLVSLVTVLRLRRVTRPEAMRTE